MHRDYCIIRDKNLIQEEQNGFDHRSKKSIRTAGTRVSEDGLRSLLLPLSSPRERLQSHSALPLEVVKGMPSAQISSCQLCSQQKAGPFIPVFQRTSQGSFWLASLSHMPIPESITVTR